VIELPPGESLPIHVVARALACHRKHLVNLIEAGDLEAYDLRGPHSSRSTIRVTRQTLIQWLESRKIPKV
jgi:hypothetical protein